MIYVKLFGSEGRGVATSRAIEPGVEVTANPVALVEIDAIDERSGFSAYPLAWSDTHNAIAFGLISLVNHADDPNCEIVSDHATSWVRLRTLRKVAVSEQLTVRYRCALWFTPA